MSERLHPSTERLQAYAEESLDGAERAAVRAHVVECAECGAEVAELRSLFEALSGLTAFAPSAGFADRVMTEVRVRKPAFAGITAWTERLVPQTTRAWAAAAAVLALPVVGASLLVGWVMSQPGVTAQGLWTLANDALGQVLSTSWHWALARFAGTSIATWLTQALELVGSLGHRDIGLAAVTFALVTVGSIYVLYQNLFRTQARRTEHASYVF
ncbi:MAG: anti-sigma factor family protein [Gemmatimonadota bacterium]